MRVIIQRVTKSSVSVDEQIVGESRNGFLLLVGVTESDTNDDVVYCARKIAQMRIFEDEEGKMNRSIIEVGGSILSISQFTLYANTRKGNRPSFTDAAKPEFANEKYEELNEALREYGLSVETGQFGEMMMVSLVNDGPVTIILDSKER